MANGYRHSASFGKRQEFGAIAEMLRRGYDVYVTLVDDQGIDCVVRQGPNKYFDVQIKARSRDCNPRNAGHFPMLQVGDPRKSYVFIFYSEQASTYWVIPASKIVSKGFCNLRKSGGTKGRYRILLTNYSRARNIVTPRPKYKAYENAFDAAFGPPIFERRKPDIQNA